LRVQQSPAVDVPAQVRRELETARAAGVEFGDAWPAVLARVTDRHWRDALARTAAAWREAYDREAACPRWVTTLEDVVVLAA
jgi:hypothetical protein